MKAQQKPRKSQKKSDPQPRAAVSPRTRHILVLTALLIVTLLAYSNSFDAGLTLDNKGILHDPRLSQATAQNIGLILHHTYWWPTGESGLYRPFTSLSYMLNYAVFGNRDQTTGYHWINFILHCANILLVYFLLLRLTGQFWISAAVAALWAVHPVLTESVTNIVGRADLLAGLATLSGFLMYLKSADSAGWRRAAWLVALAAVTAIGVFSKESAVCILGVIVAYELTWWKRTRMGALLLGCLATLIPIAALLYQRSNVLAASLPPEFPFTDNPIVGASFWIGRLTALKVIARYLWLIVWPAKLSVDYSYSEIPLASGSFADCVSWIVIACAIVAIVLLYRGNRTAFFWALFAAVTFVPMSNLLFPIGTIMAERFLYLPAIGVLACLVMEGYTLIRRARIERYAPLILCLAVAALAIRTWARNVDWQDDLSIATASLEVSPNSAKLHQLVATLLFEGDRTPAKIELGTQEAEKSVALLQPLPDFEQQASAYCLEGGYYILAQQYEKTIATLRKCAAIDQSVRQAYAQKLPSHRNPALVPSPGDPQPYLMLALTYLHLNDLANATLAARQALRLHPRNPAAYGQIANVFLMNHRQEDAADALAEGFLLTSDPNLAKPLFQLYQRTTGSSACALIEASSGAEIDPRCEPFRENACAVAGQVIEARLESNRVDLAEQQRAMLSRDYGCGGITTF